MPLWSLPFCSHNLKVCLCLLLSFSFQFLVYSCYIYVCVYIYVYIAVQFYISTSVCTAYDHQQKSGFHPNMIQYTPTAFFTYLPAIFSPFGCQNLFVLLFICFLFYFIFHMSEIIWYLFFWLTYLV